MSLCLGKLGRRLLAYTVDSPRLDKVVGNIGRRLLVFGLPHYREGLTRSAYRLSRQVSVGDKLTIRDGNVIRGDKTILSHPLFQGIRIDQIEVTNSMSTPEGMASYFRWGLFSDPQKVGSFLRIFSPLLGIHLATHAYAWTLFEQERASSGDRVVFKYARPLFEIGDWRVIFRPMFHSFDDPSSTFAAGEFFVKNRLASLPLTLIFILSSIKALGEFRKDELIHLPMHRNWSRFANVSLALTLIGALTQFSSRFLFRGVWDYLHIGRGSIIDNYFTVMNSSDLLIYFGLLSMITTGFIRTFTDRPPELPS